MRSRSDRGLGQGIGWCAVGAVFAGVSFLCAGCAGGASEVRGTQPTLSIGISTPVATLNPITQGTSEEANFDNFVWAGLLGYDADGYPFPMLARSVPTYGNKLIAPNGRTLTFRLKPNLTWSDGRRITAQDVRFGWLVATKRWADVCPATCRDIHDVVVDSPTKVTFALDRPFGPLLFDLPPILPQHFVWKGSWRRTEQFLFQASTNWFGARFPVDGPFRVSKSSGGSLLFARNPTWHLLQKPAFASIRVSTYPTDSALLSAVRSGTVDLAQGFNTADFVNRIIVPTQLGNLKLQLYPVGGVEHLEPNLLKAHSPLNDVRVRQALNLAIDRGRLIQAGLAIPRETAKSLVAYGPEIPGRFDGLAVSGAWDPIKSRFVTRPQPGDAAKLLARAGWKLFRNLTYRATCPQVSCEMRQLWVLVPKTYVYRIQEAQALQTNRLATSGAWWGKHGLDVPTKLNFTQWAIGNLVAPYKENGPCARGWDDFCLFAQGAGYDPQTDFQLEFTSAHISRRCPQSLGCSRGIGKSGGPIDLNFAGIRDREIDHIFAAGADTFDLAKRRSLYRKWQVRVAKMAYWIPLYYQPLVVVERREPRNFHPTTRGAEWNAWALKPRS